MQIILNESTKILELVKQFPSLMDALIDLSPKLKKLNNPILKKTIGKRANLKDVSKLADISLNLIYDRIAKELAAQPDVTVTVDKGAKGSNDWSNELEDRQKKLKEIILELHSGADMNGLQDKFKAAVEDITASEIAEMEQNLIDAGELTVDQVTSMCDLHVSVFRDSLEDHESPESIPGHPVHTYLAENRVAEDYIKVIRKNITDLNSLGRKELKDIITHYTRLENQLFPLLEKAGVSGPSTVMWAIHDEVREEIKALETLEGEPLKALLEKVEDMVYKEDKILFPMALESLSEQDWGRVRNGEEEIGYAWVTPGTVWKPVTVADIHGAGTEVKLTGDITEQIIQLSTGGLSVKKINLILKNLPIDISFIGAEETVEYYSANKERIFPRSPAVIGRKVQNCHPKKSVDKVQQILNAFRDGSKDEAAFWITMGGKFLLIKYFAIRDDDGKFLGTLEVSQDVTEIRALTGQKTLLDW